MVWVSPVSGFYFFTARQARAMEKSLVLLVSPREVSQFAAAEVRHRLEEDVRRFDVGEQQAVRIAGHRRTLDLLVFGHLLVERHVERQRAVNDDLAQLAAVGHLGQQRAFGRGDHVGEQLLRGGDAGDFRGLDAQQVRRAGQVADLHHLLLEVSSLW